MNRRSERLAAARLYLVCDDQADHFLTGALEGGVDIVQLRVKGAAPEAIADTARRFRRRCHEHGSLFIVNDHPELAADVGADGVHLGQEDMPVGQARRIVGPDCLIGLSTHTPAQVDAAGQAEVDYIGVGPVNATPTKPGRPAVGLELVRYAAARSTVPFFAIGGLRGGNLGPVLRAGGQRIAVVRALTDSPDPRATARELRRMLNAEQEAPVGAT